MHFVSFDLVQISPQYLKVVAVVSVVVLIVVVVVVVVDSSIQISSFWSIDHLPYDFLKVSKLMYSFLS